MKKLLFIIAIMVGVLSASARDTYSHDLNILPQTAQTVLKNNFDAALNHIKIDKEWGSISEYDVVLTDGTEITFDKNGNWKEIEVNRNSSVPLALVPESILTYVRKNHKDVTITGIEKKKSEYTIELSNGREIKFDSKGQFKRYDD